MQLNRRALLQVPFATALSSTSEAVGQTKTFVLVPGAWHGAWCFRRLEPLLRAKGHQVFAITLSGLGEHAHQLRKDIDLFTHVEDVVRLIEVEALQGVTLLGHSYAGMVVTQVASRVAERISQLVYLDAFVPDRGQSMFDLAGSSFVERSKKRVVDGWKVPPMLDAKSMGVDAKDAAWVDARLTPQSMATFEQKCDFDPERLAKLPKLYLHCRKFSGFKLTAARVRALGWPVVELDCGHDAMLEAPQPLAAAL